MGLPHRLVLSVTKERPTVEDVGVGVGREVFYTYGPAHTSAFVCCVFSPAIISDFNSFSQQRTPSLVFTSALSRRDGGVDVL